MNDKLGNCIAFYEVEPETFDIEEWYKFILDWFKEYQQAPSRMGLGGDLVKPSTQTKTFKHYDRVIRDIQYKFINHLWIGSTPPNHHIDSIDAIFSASFNFMSKGKDSVLTFDNAVIPFTQEAVEKLVKEATQYFTSFYTIAFQRHFDKGSLYYARGAICNGGYPGEDKRAISRWLHRYGDPEKYEVGDLRDIYPMNFISKAHLSRSVGNTTLQDWILSSPRHGRLKPLTNVLWSWVVAHDDITGVREELKKANLLVVYRE